MYINFFQKIGIFWLVLLVVLLEIWAAFFIIQPRTVHAATRTITVDITTDEDNGAGSGCSLREAVIAANTGADYNQCTISGALSTGDRLEIQLDAGETHDLDIVGDGEDEGATGDLDVTSTADYQIVIGAKGSGYATINLDFGGSEDRAFHFLSGTATYGFELNGIKFTNNNTAEVTGIGGFVLAEGGDLEIINGLFDGGYASSNAGALGYTTSDSLTINSTTFQNNIGGSGGGAVIISSGEAELNSVNFVNNTSEANGGAIYSSSVSVLNISSSTFSQNTSTDEGGAIFAIAIGQGTSSTITNTRFENNGSDTDGGAVYVNQTISPLDFTFTNSIFENNTASTTAATGEGGAVYFKSDTGELTFTSSSLSYNAAMGDGGAVHLEAGDLTITSSTFSYNSSTDSDGGAFYTDETSNTLTITNSTFQENEVDNTSEGGALSIESADFDVTISNTNFIDNEGGFGGAIHTEDNIDVENSTFNGNRGTDAGGAIYSIVGGKVTHNITSSTFYNNWSSDTGGALWTEGGDFDVENSTFSQNHADVGGAIHVSSFGAANTLLSHVTFAFNTATSSGAGIRVVDNTIFFDNTLFVSNTLSAGSLENCDTSGTGTLTSLGYNLEAINGGSETCDMGTNDVTTTAAISTIINSTLADNGGDTFTHALPEGSPAIDVGTSDFAVDQRGITRPEGANPDIGAYEYEVTGQGVDVSEAGISITEAGTDSYNIVLDAVPNSDVVITITETSDDISLNSTEITFTTSTWNIPQTITVTAVDDNIVESTEIPVISHSVASSDTNYNGISISSVSVTVLDNDGSSGGGGGVFYLEVLKENEKKAKEIENLENTEKQDEEKIEKVEERKRVSCELGINKAYKHPDPNRKDVWLVVENPLTGVDQCYRRAFESELIFYTYFDSFGKVLEDERIDLLPADPLGFMPVGPRWERQYGAVVKSPFDPTMYLLIGEYKYSFDSGEIYQALGYQWKWVEDVDARVLDQYELLENIDYTDHHPVFSMVKYRNSPRIFQIVYGEDKELVIRQVVDTKIYRQLQYRPETVVEIPASERYKEVLPITEFDI